MTHIWLNGTFLSAQDGQISVSERGFLLGDGAFETLRLDHGHVRRWPRHMARLSQTLETLQIPCPDLDDIRNSLDMLCNLNGVSDAVIRLSVGRGALGGGMHSETDHPPTVLLTTSDLPEPLEPLRLITLDGPRRDVRNLSSRAKLLGYGDLLDARRQAMAQGADMALLLSTDGHLSCADSANLFWMQDGDLYTPDLSTGCLPGTTRAAVLEAATEQGIGVQTGAFEPECLKTAEAVLITNAVRGAVPVCQIDAQSFEDPRDRYGAVFDLARTAD